MFPIFVSLSLRTPLLLLVDGAVILFLFFKLLSLLVIYLQTKFYSSDASTARSSIDECKDACKFDVGSFKVCL